MLETGSCRAKNASNVLMKNLAAHFRGRHGDMKNQRIEEGEYG
jgi:hypothetical protein